MKNSRLRNDWVTISRNIACAATEMVDEFGALDDDALARLQPLHHQHALAVERLDADRPLFEPLGGDMLKDHVLTGAAAHDARARHRDALLLLRRFGEHGDELTDAHAGGVALNRKMNRDRLIAVSEAGAAENETDLLVADARGGAVEVRQRLVAQRFDPQPRRIDDVEDDGVGLCDLAGNRRAVRHNAINWRNKRFGFAPHLVERRTTLVQALEFEPGLVDRHA
jgi:hypothetical protein